ELAVEELTQRKHAAAALPHRDDDFVDLVPAYRVDQVHALGDDSLGGNLVGRVGLLRGIEAQEAYRLAEMREGKLDRCRFRAGAEHERAAREQRRDSTVGSEAADRDES